MATAALHEIYAAGEADVSAAAGFAIGLALRTAGGQPILWVRHDAWDYAAGRLYPPGLAEMGLNLKRLLLVRAPDATSLLKAGDEAARCPGLGAVLIAPWGKPRVFDLTASRRLSLAARAAGVTVLVVRAGAEPVPSAAMTRWRVRAAASTALAASAPGQLACAVELLRQRGGAGGNQWQMEWDRDRQAFSSGAGFSAVTVAKRAALPGVVVAVAFQRTAAAGGRRAMAS